jgi:hypothetical protein
MYCRYRGFLFYHTTLRHTTLSRTPLDEWSDRRRYLYLTTHNTHNRQTSNPPPVGFEPAIPASERPQNHATDRPTTEIGPDFIVAYVLGIKILHVVVWVRKACTSLKSVPSVRTCSLAGSNQISPFSLRLLYLPSTWVHVWAQTRFE